jgi:DNA-binding MarR family transcriptional regulator
VATRTPPRRLTPLDDAVALRVAVARIHRAVRSRSPRALTLSQSSALSRVEECGPLRLGVLAQREGVAPATMSKVVDALASAGMIERVADAEDARASLVRVTPLGAQTLHEIRSASTRVIHDALATLSDAERSRLRRALPVLDRLASALQSPADTTGA